MALLLPFFSFDSGAFINGRRDIFILPTFAAVWTNIQTMITHGQVRAIEEVRHEVTRHDDDTGQWVKAQQGLFEPLTPEVQKATSKVLAKHPKLISLGSSRSSADPFVIALAVANSGTVVTQETPSNKLHKPRIPDVCMDMGVPWMTLPQFVADQGWSFTQEESPTSG